jgi:hypothetical protein
VKGITTGPNTQVATHMTYIMSYVTSLNNTCGWSYKLSHSGLVVADGLQISF